MIGSVRMDGGRSLFTDIIYNSTDQFKHTATGFQLSAAIRSEIQSCYAVAGIFALASTHEGLPITVLEAMAAERAVVATDIPGVREVVTDGEAGLLVTPRSHDEFGAAMMRLTDKGLRLRLAGADHERPVSELSIETTEAYEDFYREVTA